jgi:1-acyl-sn-glycerol-3-phosphate acyltransferase
MIYTMLALAHLIFFFTIGDFFNAKKIEKFEDRRERSLATLNRCRYYSVTY